MIYCIEEQIIWLVQKPFEATWQIEMHYIEIYAKVEW